MHFLVNDAVCFVIHSGNYSESADLLKLNPIPYLIAEILASNIGSAMTITGNPQNILIGMQSGIPSITYVCSIFCPISFIGMLLIVVIDQTAFSE
ncbi:MAG: hypothetical protein MZV64_02100 [Ignavibacteriales bacterium]|nr:hypothetical protein [Ignavibacteriales bacterium]